MGGRGLEDRCGHGGAVTVVKRSLLLGYQRNSVGVMESERGRVGNGWWQGRLIGNQGVIEDRRVGGDG